MHHEAFRNGRATTPSPRSAPEKAPVARTDAHPFVTGSSRAEGLTPGVLRGQRRMGTATGDDAAPRLAPGHAIS